MDRGLDFAKELHPRAALLYAKGVNECVRVGLPLSALRVEYVTGLGVWRFTGQAWRVARMIWPPMRLCRWLDAPPRPTGSMELAAEKGEYEFYGKSASRAWVEFETTQDANYYSLPNYLTVLVPRSKYSIEALQMAFARRQQQKDRRQHG